jgi:hypothetical protein
MAKSFALTVVLLNLAAGSVRCRDEGRAISKVLTVSKGLDRGLAPFRVESFPETAHILPATNILQEPAVVLLKRHRACFRPVWK